MTKYFLLPFLFIILFSDISFSQEVDEIINNVEEEFKNFEYAEVIRDSENLLRIKRALTNQQLFEIYTMKGIAHYTLAEDDNTRECFLEILKIDSSYSLDESRISPKIISFFNTVKQEYIQNLPEPEPEVKTVEIIKVDTVFIPKIIKDVESETMLKNSMIRSVILPGSGHLYNGVSTKGWILVSLSALSLGSSIYFIIDTNKKEKEYLQERSRNLIEDKYNSYNISYRMKNISLSLFAAVWLYSQLDLLFFSDDEPSDFLNSVSLGTFHHNQIIFSYQIKF
jgi:hypothetical protein